MLGTSILPEPTAIRIETGSPFSTLVPSFGVWLITEPAGSLSLTSSFWFGSSLSSALVSFSSALNAEASPVTLGTSVSWGMLRKSRNSSSASSRITGISHHGSHGFCANVPWVGSSGPVGALDCPPRRLSIPWPACALSEPICGPCTCGARICGMRTLSPPGPIVTPGGYSCGLKTRGGYMPGTCGGRRRYHFFFGAGPCCCRTSAPTGSAARRSAASSPVIVLTSSRRSEPRPIQICLGGRTCICEPTAVPAGISCGGRLKPNCSSPSGSSPSSATSTGALALLVTVMS